MVKIEANIVENCGQDCGPLLTIILRTIILCTILWTIIWWRIKLWRIKLWTIKLWTMNRGQQYCGHKMWKILDIDCGHQLRISIAGKCGLTHRPFFAHLPTSHPILTHVVPGGRDWPHQREGLIGPASGQRSGGGPPLPLGAPQDRQTAHCYRPSGSGDRRRREGERDVSTETY